MGHYLERAIRLLGVSGVLAIVLAGCAQESVTAGGASNAGTARADAPHADAEHPVQYSEQRKPCANFSEQRMALFGDVHVHTSFSFDAAANSIGTTPADANRFARGEAIPFWPLDEAGRPAGTKSIDRPLDFLAVTDHGEFLGERALCRVASSPKFDTTFCEQVRSDQRLGMRMLGTVITTETPERIAELCGEDGALCRTWSQEPWSAIVAAAEAAYDRSENCAFTSFVGYEYTGTPGTSNLHRNVLFRNGNVPAQPVSYVDAPTDSQLWQQLDAACESGSGCDYLSIPHNSNLANNRFAPYSGLADTLAEQQTYARKRQQREPIMEIFQHKGSSECVNGLTSVLAAPDELCDVEQVRVMGETKTYATQVRENGKIIMGQGTVVTRECEPGETGANGMLGAGCIAPSDFMRSGLLEGMSEAERIGVNPIKLGIIASTDTHASTPGAVAEDDWGGHVSGEATPEERLQPGLLTSGIDGNPGGLAGVWAIENSRDAIFDAMLRREVFGTSGPRIAPRLFAGWEYSANLCDAPDMVAQGYAGGVPMGADLPAASSPQARPHFVAFAAKDPAGRPLQRLQLIKGWIDGEGIRRNQVIDIAGSKERSANALCSVYVDNDYDATESAYYYLRALEVQSPRWTQFDCERIAESERPAVCSDGSYPDTIVEMAWTSPIWVGAAAGR